MAKQTRRSGAVARAIPLALVLFGLLAAVFALAPSRLAAQSTDEIVARILAARGGLEKAKAVRSERISGTIYFSPEFFGPFVAEFKRPGKMHNEVTIQSRTVVRTLNGKGAGWVLNPFAGKDKPEAMSPEAMSPEELKDAGNESDFDGPLIDAKAKGNTIEFSRMEQVEGKDAYVLKVTHKDGTVSDYAFDAKTYLLAKWSGTDNVNGESVTRETLFHDYREVNGLKFPFELISSNPGADPSQRLTQRIVVEKVEVDPQIDEAHFEKPAAAAAPGAAGDPPAAAAGRH